MEKFIEKFNIFDIFTMLLPGIAISCLYAISLSYKLYDIWKNCGGEKYLIFFIFAYIIGLILQEIGTILDQKFTWRYLYGGEPRQIFLSENYYKKIFDNELEYKNALKIKKYLKKYVNSDTFRNENEKAQNSLMFEYCLNICEMNGITFKADKMLIISEMSRSICWGCISTIILNLILILFFLPCPAFLYYEIPILMAVAIIFLIRKKRYEQYRFRIMIRLFLIYIEQQPNKI